MDENEKTTLIRTKLNLLRNLECVNDAIDSSVLPLGDHMVLDDIKDTLKGLKCIKELLGSAGGETAVAKAAAKTMPGIV